MDIDAESKILIIGQHFTARTETLRDYLLLRKNHLFIIALGPAFIKRKENHLFYYKNGILEKHYIRKHNLLKRFKTTCLLIPATFFLYIWDIFCAIIIFKTRFDLFIGISHFSGMIGILFKKLGICKKSIYYAIDYYAPFSGYNIFNRLLLKSANFADKVSVLYSDQIWDISPRISEGREKFSGIKKERYILKNKIVPLGYSKSFFRNKDLRCIDRYAIVFVGVIVEGQGLELILEALPEIKKELPDIKIRIIGSGPFLLKMKKIVAEKDLEDLFKFYGFIENEKEMLDIIASSAVGISIWDDRKNKKLNSYFGDPGKTKLYSVCGLPVIVSNSTVYSQIVSENGAGKAISYDCHELIETVKEILNPNNYSYFKNRASIVAAQYCDADKIFSCALNGSALQN